MEDQFKNLKEKYSGILLGTHSAKFHLDEVMATAILINLFPDAKLLRTRDQNALDQCDIVYDIGGVFDSSKLRFDHHQRSFNETFSKEFDVKLSSAGLVFRHFANELLEKYEIKPTKDTIKEIYEEYFLFIDAVDNGIDNPMKYRQRGLASVVHDFYQPTLSEDENELNNFFPDLIIPVKYESKSENHNKKRMNQKKMKISDRRENTSDSDSKDFDKEQKNTLAGDGNKQMFLRDVQTKLGLSEQKDPKGINQKDNSDNPRKNNRKGTENTNEIAVSYSNRFKMALKFIYRDLNNFLRRKQTFYEQLESGLKLFLKCDSYIFVVPADHDISQDVIFTLNKRYSRNIMFIIYETKCGVFRMYAMRKSHDSFECLCPLKEEWRGYRDRELQEMSEIKTAIFVHASGFTGGASSLDDAIRMCEISLEEFERK